MCYIYGLFDPHTGELRYVGQTIKKRLYKRLRQHCQPSSLRRSSYKTNWIKKLILLGLRPVISQIQCLDAEDLNGAEVYWIQYFRELGCDLTNGTLGGTSPQIRQSRLGKKHSPETIAKISKPVWDNFGNCFLSVEDASRKLNIHASSISAVARGRQRTAGGRVFRYDNKFLSSPIVKSNKRYNSRPVLDDMGIEYLSATEAEKVLNIYRGGVSRAILQNKSINGHTFKYLDSESHQSRPIIDDAGNYYSDATEAARQLNLNPQSIRSVARGDDISTGGRIFRYATKP